MLTKLKSIYNSLYVYPTVKWIRLGVILQTIGCVLLAILSAVMNPDLGSVDSPWYYLLQLPVTGMVIYVLRCGSMATKRRIRYMLMYAGITMVFGIISGFYFMMFANDLEITKRKCDDDATLSQVWCDDEKEELSSHIVRSAVYVAVQLLALHPIVSYVIELWGLEKSQ